MIQTIRVNGAKKLMQQARPIPRYEIHSCHFPFLQALVGIEGIDRKSTRLNSRHSRQHTALTTSQRFNAGIGKEIGPESRRDGTPLSFVAKPVDDPNNPCEWRQKADAAGPPHTSL